MTEKKETAYLLVNMAEDKEREVQDVKDEVDELYDPLRDNLDTVYIRPNFRCA